MPRNRIPMPRRWSWVWAAAGTLAVLLLPACSQRKSSSGPASSRDADRATAVAHQLQLPTPRPADWVGSQICSECHSAIAQEYASHPMANSCSSIAEGPVVEVYQNHEFASPDHRRYRAEKSADGRVVHHETLADQEGLIYDLAVEVAYAVGSGQRGRSYLAQKNGLLFQSPITWYSQERKWDLSPGYDPRNHERFERSIGDGCLYCHIGRPARDPAASHRYDTPAFAEFSIGCERCHGPGQRHVEYQRSGSPGRDPIVNPAKLDPERREAVCNICHLQGRVAFRRFGRSFFDFRPGDRLEDTMLIFVAGERVDDERQTLPVSQVEQMRSSRCYQASSGAMGCISCHDPHRVPNAGSRAEAYRQSCLKCHAEGDCSAPDAQRQDVGDSCVQCHMPPLPTRGVAHTSLTDHRVLRRPESGTGSKKRADDPFDLRLFADPSRIPRRERDRAQGLMLMEAAEGLQSRQFAYQAQRMLVPENLHALPLEFWLLALENDPDSLDALGRACELVDQPESAEPFWEATRRLQPTAARALFSLSERAAQRRDWTAALEALERFTDGHPFAAEPHARRAWVLMELDRVADAAAALQTALALAPTRQDLRQQLIQLHRQAGNHEAAERESATARRIQQALP